MSTEDRSTIHGLGKGSIAKIEEMLSTNGMLVLNDLKDKTPSGIVELIGIKGLGPKRIKKIWESLDIADPVELLYACTENRLLSLKGFGPKVQADLIIKLKYHIASKGKLMYAEALPIHTQVEDMLHAQNVDFTVAGDMLELNTIVTALSYLIFSDLSEIQLLEPFVKVSDNHYKYSNGFTINFIQADKEKTVEALVDSLAVLPETLTPEIAAVCPPVADRRNKRIK